MRVTNDQVADQDLENLGLEACSIGEQFLQNADEHMPKGSTNQCAVCCHFGYSRTEIVAILAAIMREPRGQDFLQCGKSTRGEHFRPQRIRLKLLEICLAAIISLVSIHLCLELSAYSEIA